jgi:hypothetical protein
MVLIGKGVSEILCIVALVVWNACACGGDQTLRIDEKDLAARLWQRCPESYHLLLPPASRHSHRPKPKPEPEPRDPRSETRKRKRGTRDAKEASARKSCRNKQAKRASRHNKATTQPFSTVTRKRASRHNKATTQVRLPAAGALKGARTCFACNGVERRGTSHVSGRWGGVRYALH